MTALNKTVEISPEQFKETGLQEFKPVARVNLYKLVFSPDIYDACRRSDTNDRDLIQNKTHISISPEEAEEIRRRAFSGFYFEEVDSGSTYLYLPSEGNSEIRIGRNEQKCQLTAGLDKFYFLDESGAKRSNVSNIHAIVRAIRDNKGYYIEVEDSSSNGTYLNDELKISHKRQPFKEGFFFSFGPKANEPESLVDEKDRLFRVRYFLTDYGRGVGVNRDIPDLE